MDRSHHSLPRYTILGATSGPPQSLRQTLPAPTRAPGSRMNATAGQSTQRWQQVVAPPPTVFDTLSASARSLTPFAPAPPASLSDPSHLLSIPARATSPVAPLDTRHSSYPHVPQPQPGSARGGSTSSRGRGFAPQARSLSGPQSAVLSSTTAAYYHQPQPGAAARPPSHREHQHPQGLLFLPSSTSPRDATGSGRVEDGMRAGMYTSTQVQEAEDTGLQALQLLRRVDSLHSKADALLKQYGRCPTREPLHNNEADGADTKSTASGSARFPHSHSASRFALLSEKLASLEDLLDDLAQTSLRPGHPATRMDAYQQPSRLVDGQVPRAAGALVGPGGSKSSPSLTPRTVVAAPQFHRLPSPSPVLAPAPSSASAVEAAGPPNKVVSVRAPTRAAQDSAATATTPTAPTSASTTPPHSGGLISVRVLPSSTAASSRSSSVRTHNGGTPVSAPYRAHDLPATTGRSRDLETARGQAMASGHQSAPAPRAFAPAGCNTADRHPTPPRRFVEVGYGPVTGPSPGWPSMVKGAMPGPPEHATPQGCTMPPSTNGYYTGATPRQQVPRSAFLHYASWSHAQSGLSQSVPRVRSATPSATFSRPSAVVRTQSGSVTPVSGCGTPRQGAPPLAAFHQLQDGLIQQPQQPQQPQQQQHHPSPRMVQGPSRAFSAPWTSKAAPPPVTLAGTLQKTAPPKDSAEAKIRDWLTTISIGNGTHRGWDDSQILDIANFAEAQKLGQLKAEDIYRRYVEYQVEKANQEEDTTPSQSHRKESGEAGGGGGGAAVEEASDSDDGDNDEEDQKAARRSW